MGEAQPRERRITVTLPPELFRWLKFKTIDHDITTQALLIEIVRVARAHEQEIDYGAAER